jgi:hypothetical protein
MIIQKKSIRNIAPYIRHIKDGSKITLGITDPQRFSTTLKRIGFSEPFEKGQTILPAGIGSVSRYNAEGKTIVHKELPMETAYRQTVWHWTEWHGRYDRVERSKIVDVPYKRYPRSFEAPPAVELSLSENKAGVMLLTAPIFEKKAGNNEQIKHAINLFLELFHECQFFTEDLETIAKTTLRRLNWVVLPQGEMPWESLKKEVDPIVKSAPKGNQEVLYYRLKTINALKPDFRAVGSGGFHGYIVHGFTKNNIYVLESMYYGNATYIFGETWEELSKMTKAEILNEKLQKARVIHRGGWRKKVEEIIGGGDTI